MDRQLERTVDEVRWGIDALISEIERLELLVSELQDLVEKQESKIEDLQDNILELGEILNL